jgi:hypothetical protein
MSDDAFGRLRTFPAGFEMPVQQRAYGTGFGPRLRRSASGVSTRRQAPAMLTLCNIRKIDRRLGASVR